MLSVVIPSGGDIPRLRCTLICLAAAIRGEGAAVDVVIVNDGGAPGIRECVTAAARQTATGFRLVEVPRGGRSAARNTGAAHSRGERLLFIDSDVLVEKEVIRFHSRLGNEAANVIYRGTIAHLPWLAAFEDPVSGKLSPQAVSSLRVSPEGSACLLASRTLSPEVLDQPELLRTVARSSPFQRDLQRWFRDNPSDVAASWIGCTGGQVSVHRSVFQMLGGFDERMGLRWGAEDLEFGYRAAQAGIPIRYAGSSLCFHMDHPVNRRQEDHDWALTYFAGKHSNQGILRILDYFSGRCDLTEALEACHVSA